jgi:hypothetical protein
VKVWVYVEGESDKLALYALWRAWMARLRAQRIGIVVVPLDNKAQFLRKIGPRAAEKLCNSDNPDDIVVGLPDLHPIVPFNGTQYEHKDWVALKKIQGRQVTKALKDTFCVARTEAYMKRFLGSALKHDLEMLLLAASDSLKAVLETNENLGHWRHPVEDQNLNNPPKRVVADLFLHHSRRKRAYTDTVDAGKVLGNVASDIRPILWSKSGQLECPVFKEVLDWIGEQTGVRAY